jgi:hypothetical protein
VLLSPGIFVNIIFIPLNPFGSINSFCTHCPYLFFEECSQTVKIHIVFLLSSKAFSYLGFGDVSLLGHFLLKAIRSSAQNVFSTFCISVSLWYAQKHLSLSLSVSPLSYIYLYIYIYLKPSKHSLWPWTWAQWSAAQACGLTKGFRSLWLSLMHLPPASISLIQMTAAGTATSGLCCCKMLQSEPNPFCQADCKWRPGSPAM